MIVTKSRVVALVRCILAGGKGSARFHFDVYEDAIKAGYIESVPWEGYRVTTAGLGLVNP